MAQKNSTNTDNAMETEPRSIVAPVAPDATVRLVELQLTPPSGAGGPHIVLRAEKTFGTFKVPLLCAFTVADAEPNSNDVQTQVNTCMTGFNAATDPRL